jgi:hypothetical protein
MLFIFLQMRGDWQVWGLDRILGFGEVLRCAQNDEGVEGGKAYLRG